MSRKSDSPNSKEAANQYVTWLANLGIAEGIYITGSRSPQRDKQPHDHSDWDIVLTTKVEGLRLVSPRTGNRLHGDLLIIQPEQLEHIKSPVEVWPNDEHGLLK